MDYIFESGTTNKTINVFIQDAVTGLAKTGLAYNSAGAKCYYIRPRAAATQITLATLASATAAHSDGGFIEIDATNAEGMYRLDLPDAPLADGALSVVVNIQFDDAHINPVLIALNPQMHVVDIETTMAEKIADVLARRTAANIKASSFGDTITNGQSLYGAICRLMVGYEEGTTANTLDVKDTDDAVLDTHTVTVDAAAVPITGMNS